MQRITPASQMKRRLSRITVAARPYVDCGNHLAAVVDIIADLQHYADAHDVSFNAALRFAREHYEAEKAGEL